RSHRHHEGRRGHPDRHAGGTGGEAGDRLRRRVHARRAARQGDLREKHHAASRQGAARGHGIARRAGGELLGRDHRRQEAVRGCQRRRQADRRGDARGGHQSPRRPRQPRSACVTIAADAGTVRARPVQTWLAIWAAALAIVLAMFLARGVVPWTVNYPAWAVVPVDDWIGWLMNWLKVNLSWLTRSITAVLGVP